ncbi:MAG TPA: RluA family pseudouridine synthase [Candidatus Paceibacterota bacterium]|nr:RluA family pseudouridine synthase [Candidatus Paceibacterota bacterium]
MNLDQIFEKIVILYEDDELLAIDKPSGLVVHSDGRTDEPSVADWLERVRPEIKDVGEPWTRPDGTTLHRPGIVHRIDRETSGVLLICKTQDLFLRMKEKFKKREVGKSYLAFLYGELRTNEGVIDRPIAKSRKDFRLWSAQPGGRGEMREAATEYRVIERGSGFTYVEARPKTGRTHQIRVHFKAINYPIVGDRLYAPKREMALGFKRLALHAAKISFTLENKGAMVIEAPIPDDFQRAEAAMTGRTGESVA